MENFNRENRLHESAIKIRKPFEIEHKDYDVIIVDGRCRVMCCYMASFFLKDGGYIVFDDFNNRTYYHGVLKYYEIIALFFRYKIFRQKILFLERK